jgi:hypothetical protein
MRCQCEDQIHLTAKGCKREGYATVDTIYGKYFICQYCIADHPIPKEFLKK